MNAATPHKEAHKLTDEEATQRISRALADPIRYEIVRMLAQRDGGKQCSAVRDCFDIAPQTLSHHMKELRDAGLVLERRTGRTVQYTFSKNLFDAYIGQLRRDFIE